MVREVFSKKLKTGIPGALGSESFYKVEIWFPGTFMTFLDTTKKLSNKQYLTTTKLQKGLFAISFYEFKRFLEKGFWARSIDFGGNS